jgi:hypothetical protein
MEDQGLYVLPGRSGKGSVRSSGDFLWQRDCSGAIDSPDAMA